nr:FAD-dependent monooxygenase [Streptomyces sp. NBC_01754]
MSTENTGRAQSAEQAEWTDYADPEGYDFDVLVVGGGPVGMLLAAELRIARVRAVVLERLPERTPHSKAFGLHARSLESLDRRGLVERFRDGARSWNNGHFAGLDEWVDFSTLDSTHAYALLSEQTRTERLLEERAVEVTAEIRRGHEVTAVRQDADGAEADVTGPDGAYTLRARYIVGCDGGRSLVRGAAGIGFPGTGGRVTARLSDVILADRENAPMGMERTERGLLFCVPLDDTYHRVSTFDFGADRESRARSSPWTSSPPACTRSGAAISAPTRRAGSPSSPTPHARPTATARAGS